jgi:hypothetical protein
MKEGHSLSRFDIYEFNKKSYPSQDSFFKNEIKIIIQ